MAQDKHGDTPTSISIRPAFKQRFEVLQVLGEGAAGLVYKVKDRLRHDEIVALKVLSNNSAFDEHTLARFKKEIEVCRKIQSPNLIEAYELIHYEDTLAYTMEYVRGSDLARIGMTKNFRLPEYSEIICQVLDGLEAMHANQILHRDVKLENILLREDNIVKISDLGLVKQIGKKSEVTKTGIILGTAQYMPPEYIRGEPYEVTSDLYATGLMLLELASGKRWMSGMAGNQAIDQLLRTNFKITDEHWTGVPDTVRFVIERACAVNPKNRYSSAAEMRAAIISASSTAPAQSTPSPKPTNSEMLKIRPHVASLGGLQKKFPHPNRPTRGMLLAFLALLVLATVTALIQVVLKKSEEPEFLLKLKGNYRGDFSALDGDTTQKYSMAAEVEAGKVRISSNYPGCLDATFKIHETVASCRKAAIRLQIDELTNDEIRGALLDRTRGKIFSFTLKHEQRQP